MKICPTLSSLVTLLPFATLAIAQIPATRPALVSESGPSATLSSLSNAIASADLASIRKWYAPADRNALTPQDLLDWQQSAIKLNAAAQSRWGKDSRVADLPSEVITKTSSKLQLTISGDSAYFSSPNLSDGTPAIRFVKMNGVWQISSLGNLTNGDAQIICTSMKQTADDIGRGKYESAQQAISTDEDNLEKQIDSAHKG